MLYFKSFTKLNVTLKSEVTTTMSSFTPYFEFNRKKWASLRNHTPLPLTEEELENLKGLNVEISIEEVEKIYLPLTRLINLYVKASQQLHTATTSFLGKNEKKFLILLELQVVLQ